MALTTQDAGLVSRLNAADPNTLADALRRLGFGSMLRTLKTYLRGKNPSTAPADPYVLATLQALTLPDDAKGLTILRAYARSTSAAGTLGELTVEPYGTTPADGQIAVAPNGDIVVLAASAYTGVDVVYEPEKVDTVELTLSVTTNSLLIPANLGPAVILMEAEALVGGSTGKKIVLVPGTGPAAGQARLDVAKTHVLFAGADAVTSARVKLGVASAIDADALLESSALPIV